MTNLRRRRHQVPTFADIHRVKVGARRTVEITVDGARLTRVVAAIDHAMATAPFQHRRRLGTVRDKLTTDYEVARTSDRTGLVGPAAAAQSIRDTADTLGVA